MIDKIMWEGVAFTHFCILTPSKLGGLHPLTNWESPKNGHLTKMFGDTQTKEAGCQCFTNSYLNGLQCGPIYKKILRIQNFSVKKPNHAQYSASFVQLT